MRINQVPSGQIPTITTGVTDRPPTLTPGQRLLVTVLANDDGLLQLLAEDSTAAATTAARTFTARTELPLLPGQRLPVVVAGGDNAQIILRLANGQGELSSVTPEVLAESLGLPVSSEWQAVLTSLVRDSLPLTRELAEQVMTLWRRSKLPLPEPAVLLWLARRGISPTPERVALVRAFRQAHQGRGEPSGEAIMSTVDVPDKDGPLQFSIWMAGIDAPPVERDGHGQGQRGGDASGDTAQDSDTAAAPAPSTGRPAVVLLSVPTKHLGRVEALVELTGEAVTVTCFSDDASAIGAITAEIDRLRTSLAAVGLVPGALAARSSEVASDVKPSLRRLDVRI